MVMPNFFRNGKLASDSGPVAFEDEIPHKKKNAIYLTSTVTLPKL
jgi:hypothetical protein